jgi:hypothetical protein
MLILVLCELRGRRLDLRNLQIGTPSYCRYTAAAQEVERLWSAEALRFDVEGLASSCASYGRTPS